VAQAESVNAQQVINATQRWISSVVIGLNLCPFAERVFKLGLIRYTVSEARNEPTLLVDFAAELRLLASTPITSVETTLLIHPNVLGDFLDYNDFLGIGERVIADLELEGVIQIAGFHPAFQFAESDAGAVENYTNRSPYPMLHLLREESVSAVASDADALLEIPQRNIRTLRDLGRKRVMEMLDAIAHEQERPE
jgi:uncharacterized protein